MKKLISITLTLLMLASLSLTCFADSASTEVFVTIADDKGELVLVHENITVTDADKDGAVTLNDALICAHDARFEGGSAQGYESVSTEYGLSLIKLWGIDNGGSYGYCVNSASAMSLADTVNDGDHLYAYAFSDLETWSDTYSFFDKDTLSAKVGEEVSLKLSMAGYDAEWNPIVLPVGGAVITVNGEASEAVTDSDGNVRIKLDKAGVYVISATSESLTLVPPVCVVTVEEAATQTEEVTYASTEETEITEETEGESAATPILTEETPFGDAPQTGDEGIVFAAFLFTLSLSVIAVIWKRRIDEK